MRHDRNRSGRLDYRELRNTLEALSLDTTTSHAADLLKRYDADGNGRITTEEFRLAAREAGGEPSAEALALAAEDWAHAVRLREGAAVSATSAPPSITPSFTPSLSHAGL